MPAFAGFPPGRNPYIPVPERFFTDLLPAIEDAAELKITLHLFRLLYTKAGEPRCASGRELAADPMLRQALRRQGDPRSPEERLHAALELALARGTLLRVRVQVDDALVVWYFFNTELGREMVGRLLRGEESPARLLEVEGPFEDEMADAKAGALEGEGPELSVDAERPNIFTLYEQNIGILTPMLAEELREAERRYPAEWTAEAFRLAVQQNKRKWAYIHAILKRWENEGRGELSYGSEQRYSR
ncbi:MAG TPA: DnaD domain protein [Ktedonobacterales bacterium]|nr:DnaD domain protein [Ktedonobacterales bacterium]